jgi:uncharacterized protein (DUF58 family)
MRGVWLAVLTCALALSACSSVHRVGAQRTLTVALTEYRIAPQNISVAEGELTIVVSNYGRLAHNLTVRMDGVSEGSTQPLLPGQSAQLAVYLTPGRYVMASTILSDQALGQYGTLTVTP